MKVDFPSFQCIIFRCKWWDNFDWNNVKEGHNSGLIHINSKKMLAETKEPYVFPKHYNQLCFHPDVLNKDWRFIWRHDPRFKHLYEKNNVVMPNDDDNQGDGNEE